MRTKFTQDLTDTVKNILPDFKEYKVKVSPGQNDWTEIPWGGIRNEKAAPNFMDGLYVVYLFKADMSGVYLSLNQGVTNMKGPNRTETLKSRAKELIEELNEIPNGFNSDPIKLFGKAGNSQLFEAGNLFSKFYSQNDLDSEQDLLSDLKLILKSYEKLVPYYNEAYGPNSESYEGILNSLSNEIQLNDNNRDTDFADIDFGRAFIVRDIVYLLSENRELDSEEIFELLKTKVGKNRDYWKAYNQKSEMENKLRFNLNSARNLDLINKEIFELTDLGKKLVEKISDEELFTYNYSLKVKKFFYKLARQKMAIIEALKILKENKRMLFGGSKCDLAGRVTWRFHEDDDGKIYCDKDSYPECKNCDKDFLKHISEPSLFFETWNSEYSPVGLFFWMHSRVTPMHIEGTDPVFGGNYVAWDEKTENEINGNNSKPIKKLFISPDDIKTELVIDSSILEQVCAALNSGKHIIFTGAPGTGKTELARDICKAVFKSEFSNGDILTTATSDWTTFDTIGGYMPDNDGKTLIFHEGIFLKAIKEDKWLVIDEINRSDIDKAFGQLFTVLSGHGVELPYKNKNKNGKNIKILPYGDPSNNSSYVFPLNWRILATMNVYDKHSLFEMSYAFMRRFTFIYMDIPPKDQFELLIDKWSGNLEEEYISKIKTLLEINDKDIDRVIGPAIFKDIVEYVKHSIKLESQGPVLEGAVISYILPQFEGLEYSKLQLVRNFFKDKFGENNKLKKRIEEFSDRPLQ